MKNIGSGGSWIATSPINHTNGVGNTVVFFKLDRYSFYLIIINKN